MSTPMNSSEIIKRVISFNKPSRIGMSLPDPYHFDMVLGAREADNHIFEVLAPVGNEKKRWKDAWGNIWASLTDHDKGEVIEGALDDFSKLDSYCSPDYSDLATYENVRKLFKENEHKYKLGVLPGCVFSIARKLRGMENYLADVVLEKDKIIQLHDIIQPQLLMMVDRMADVGADGIFFCEDWGTQQQTLVSPTLWREMFKPYIAEVAKKAKSRNLGVFMHSCGKITELVGDLIEIGIDCLQFDQPRLHGIDYLSEHFAGKVTFWMPVDVQTTLQSDDKETIRAEARDMVRKLSRDNAGFIAGYYYQYEAIGVSFEMQDAACKGFMEMAEG